MKKRNAHLQSKLRVRFLDAKALPLTSQGCFIAGIDVESETSMLQRLLNLVRGSSSTTILTVLCHPSGTKVAVILLERICEYSALNMNVVLCIFTKANCCKDNKLPF